VTPDPLTIAERYGVWAGIATGLAAAIVYLYKTTVPNRVYERECAKSEALGESVAALVGDVRTLLTIVQQGGR